MICRWQNGVVSNKITAGTGKMHYRTLVLQVVKVRTQQRSGRGCQVELRTLLAHTSARIHQVTALINFQGKISMAEVFTTAFNALIPHRRTFREFVHDAERHFITGLFVEVSDPYNRRTRAGLLRAFLVRRNRFWRFLLFSEDIDHRAVAVGSGKKRHLIQLIRLG
ncbi:hypothetical protein BX31_25355 [Escherichia coli O121:H19 str. 2009EL1302]|nr:hypothetical protein BX62_04845 [Escherichia coli O121:H19 str. 2010C-4254]EZE78663.1 hypothetical protein BX31_25355 [Escherichia coli O121:H19 str. 2009EL1302]